MINELTTSTKENTISSREVAEMIGERHDSLLRKIDRINENLQNANLCSDMPVTEWIKVYGKRLHHMHLHNNFKTNDDHAGLKYGTVNFLGIVDALKTEGVSPSVVFEIFDKAQMIESIETFNKILPA